MGFVSSILSFLKGVPSTSTSSNLGYVDDYRRLPEPSKRELLEQYKQIVYTCARMNATAVASQTLRLYVTTSEGEPEVKRWKTKDVESQKLKEILGRSHIAKLANVRTAMKVKEIVEHPVLDLLTSPNPYFDNFMFMEMTDLLGEITGVGYWQILRGAFGLPDTLWLLPTQLVTPIKSYNGFVEYYTVNSGSSDRVEVADMIPFSFPNLVDPYSPEGVSPVRAYFETSKLTSKLMAFNHSLMDNRARPEVLLLPKDQLGEAEAERLERRFMRKFRRGGAGGAMVMDSAMKAELLQYSNRDLEMLALQGASKEDICNAFDVPFSMVNIKDSNRATSEAGHYQHARNAVWPRCRRNESKLNKFLAPQYDGRLFFAYDCPVPSDVDHKMKIRETNLKLGVTTINEERAQDYLQPVDWGDRPILPLNQAPLTEEEVNGETLRGRVSIDPTSSPAGKPGADAENENEDGDEEDKSPKAIRTKTALKRPCLAHREKCGHIGDHTWAQSSGKSSTVGHHRLLPDGAKLAPILRSVFEEQRIAVLTHLKSTSRTLIKTLVKSPWPDHRDWIDLTSWNSSLAKDSEDALKFYYDQGAKDARLRQGISDAKWNAIQPQVRHAVEQAALKFSESTNNTTSLELTEALQRTRDAIIEGLDSNVSLDELTKSINAIFDRADETRAAMIARTEASRALHAGQVMQLKMSGQKFKLFWLLGSNPCPICVAIAAETKDGVDPGDSFAIVGDGPYSVIEHAPAHPFCECTVVEEPIEDPKE